MPAPSSSRVKRAGSLVRRAFRDGQLTDLDAINEAIEIIVQHRATFAGPLVTANNGLRSMVRTLGLHGKVSQRLKRMSTILDKLQREPTLALDRMQDIGGCRVVLPTRDEVYALARRLQDRRPVLKVRDYIQDPRRSGYRGLHVIVEYGRQCPRPIEIQLRTESMHRWATVVEDLSGSSGVNYKQDGETTMQEFLECYARLLEQVELKMSVPEALLQEYDTLFSRAFERETDT